MTQSQYTTNAVLIPAVIIGWLDRAGLKHRNLWLANFTDVSLRGLAAQEWLIVSDQEISGLNLVSSSEEGPTATVLRTLPWTEVQSIRTQSGVGSGTLQVRVLLSFVAMFKGKLATIIGTGLTRRPPIIRDQGTRSRSRE